MLSSTNRKSWGFSFKKFLCYFLILNHIWLGCAQATNSVISDLDTQADEKAWNHLAKIRVQITPENFLNEKQGFRLQAWQTKLSNNVKELEDSDKGTMLESEQLVNLPLTYTGLKDTLPELCTQKGLHCTIGGLNLFIGWNGKVWVNGGEADSVSLETPRSLVFTQPVKVKGLTLKASHCTIQSELDVEEELEIGLSDPLKGLSIQQERGILSVQNMTLHEGHLKIQYGGTLILKDKALLDLNDNNLLNKSLLEALGDASIKNAGLIENTFHLFAPKGHLSLQAQELKNHGARIEAQNLSLNVQTLKNQSIYRPYGVDSPGIIMATENLAIEGEGTAVNKGTFQGKSVAIQNKTLTNHHLIQSSQDLKLSPQETFTNEKNGWVKIEGKGTVSGSGTIVNAGGRIDLDDPLAEEHQPLEGAGMTFQNLLFDHFTGTLMNKGSWMVSDKVTGVLTQFTNNGLWKAANSLLTLEHFENLPGAALEGSGILGNGKWTITKAGVNRHIMKGDDLEIVIQDKFRQTETGLLQGNKRLSFTGTGTADLIGQMISNQPILLDMAKLYTPGSLISSPIKTGATLEQWTIQEKAKLESKSIEFSSPRLVFKNEGEITADSLKGQAKELINELLIQVKEFFLKVNRLWNTDTLRVAGKSELTLQVLQNEGDLEFNGEVNAQVDKTNHTGTMNFGKNSVYTGQTFLKKGKITTGDNSLLDLKMKEDLDVHNEIDAKGSVNLQSLKLNTSPESKIRAKRKLSMTQEDKVQPLTLKGHIEGQEQVTLKSQKIVNKGTLLSPRETVIQSPQGLTNEGEAHLNRLDLTLNYGQTLHNTPTGSMILPSPVRLGQGGFFLNQGTMEVGDLESKNPTPGKMTRDPQCEFMENYKDWPGHMFQHMTNEGDLLLSGGSWRIRGTLYNPKGILIPQNGAHLLYNGFGNAGTILAPHGLEMIDLNTKSPLLLAGKWQSEGIFKIQSPALEILGQIKALKSSTIAGNKMTLRPESLWQSTGTGHHFWHLQQSFKNDGEVLLEGSLGIRSPKIDIGGQIQALKDSSILGQEMTIHPKGIFRDGGDKTLWNLSDLFRNDGKMEMNHWHLMTGKQGYHYGSLILGGNALIEGQNFYHKGNTWAKGNISAILSKEFDQIGEMSADGNIHLDATILFDYPHSKTKAAGELSLVTSYPLTGYWEGTQHFSWQGKYSIPYPNMISSGTLISPARTTLKVPRDFDHRGKAELNRLSMDLSYGHQLFNTGEMLLPNPVKLGHDAQLVNKKKMAIGRLDPLLKKNSLLTYDPLLNKADFDKDYIETTLLPHILKMVGPSYYPAYKDYEAFVKGAPSTGYVPNLDINKYWQSWLNSVKWGKTAQNNPLPVPYLFKGYPSFSGHLFQRMTNEGELMLSGEQYQVRGTLFNKKGATLIHRGGVELLHNVIANEGTFYAPDGMQMISKHKQGTLPLTGTWKSDGKMHLISHKVVNKGVLISPKETYVRAQWGLENEGKAHLHHLWMNVAPGHTILNHKGAELLLTDPWYMGHDFNLVNKGNMAIGKMDPPSTKASRLFLNPQSMVCTCTPSQTDDDYLKNCFLKQHQTYFNSYNGTKDTLETINLKLWNLKPGVLPTRDQVTQRVYDLETGRGVILPYHPGGGFRTVTNEGNLLLGEGSYALRGQFLNAPKAIWSIGSGVHLQANPQVIVNKSLIKFLGDSEIQASSPLVFQGEWQGLKALSFIAPALDNSVGKVRSKGILSLTSTQGDILVGHAQKVMRPVRELNSSGYQHISYWSQSGKWVSKSKDKPRSYPYTITGAGSLTNGECTYQHFTNNDALFQSGTGIKVSAKGILLNLFGLMHSQGFMTLKADKEIDNYSGIIQSQGDILFQTPHLQNRLSDVLIDRISDYVVRFDGDEGGGYIRWQHPASDPALIASTEGNLLFKINSGRNHGSRILGAKNVLFEQGGKTSSTHSSFKATSGFMSKNLVNYRGNNRYSQTYTAWDGYYPSVIHGGNTVQVVMPGVSWSQEGMMNARVIQLHLNNFDLNAHMERIGIQKHSVPDTKVRPFTQTLIINLGEMFPPSVVKALKDGGGLFKPSSSVVPKDQIVRVRQPGTLSPKNDLPFYLSHEALQGSLMQALSSIAGTLNITKEFDLEGQMRALHRQAKDKSGKGQEIVLKDQDLKELKKSFIGYVAKQIGDVQTLVAHLYLSPQDVETRNLKLASLTGDKVAVHTEEAMDIMGSIYGEHQVMLTGTQIRIERPEIRFKKEVDFTTKNGGIWGSSKTTKQILEYVLPGHGGDVETGKEGRIGIEGDHIGFKGAQIKAGIKGLDIHAKKSLVDQPFISVDHIAYDISETGTFGGSYSESGFVKKEEIHPSEFNSLGSVKMVSKGSALLQASQITAETCEGLIQAKNDLMFPGVKVTQEDIPKLSSNGTKIEKTIGSKEIGEIARIKANKVIIESLEGKISGVRPNILSKDPQIRARSIELMEEQEFRNTLQRTQKTFVVGSTVDPGLMLVMDAALTVACPGLGIVESHFLSSMIFNKGNLGDALREATSKDALKSLGTKLISAEIIKGLDLKAPVGGDFMKHVSYQMQKSLIETGTKAVIYQDKIEDGLQEALTQGLINSIASYGAQSIGKAFDTEKGTGDYLLHKTAHGLLGAAKGYALDKSKEGALSGALGAVVAEVVAEMMTDRAEVKLGVEKQALKEGWSQDKERINEEFREKLQPTLDKTKLVAGMLALASGQKVDIALQAAANALEYNFLNYAAGYISEREMELIQENSEFDPSWGMDRVGYEIAMDPYQAMEDTADMFVPGYDAYNGYKAGDYTGKQALFLAGIDFLPKERLQKIAVKGAHKMGKALRQGLQQVEKKIIHNNPLAKNNIGKAKLEQKIQTVHPLKKGVDNPSDTIRGLDLAESKSLQNNPFMQNKGRAGKQARLRSLAEDDKLGAADRGWLQQEKNHIKRGDRKNLRVPPGKDLAHKRGFEAAKGYDYSYADLQEKNLHKLQHKYDGMGKNNKGK